jgi:hypothetical protein
MFMAGIALVTKLNELERKKKFALLQSICQFMLSYVAYFQKGSKMFSEMENFIRQISKALQQVKIKKCNPQSSSFFTADTFIATKKKIQ